MQLRAKTQRKGSGKPLAQLSWDAPSREVGICDDLGLASPLSVIPARVAGIHRVASAGVNWMRCRETNRQADARREMDPGDKHRGDSAMWFEVVEKKQNPSVDPVLKPIGST